MISRTGTPSLNIYITLSVFTACVIIFCDVPLMLIVGICKVYSGPAGAKGEHGVQLLCGNPPASCFGPKGLVLLCRQGKPLFLDIQELGSAHSGIYSSFKTGFWQEDNTLSMLPLLCPFQRDVADLQGNAILFVHISGSSLVCLNDPVLCSFPECSPSGCLKPHHEDSKCKGKCYNSTSGLMSNSLHIQEVRH